MFLSSVMQSCTRYIELTSKHQDTITITRNASKAAANDADATRKLGDGTQRAASTNTVGR